MDHSAHEPGTVADCPECQALALEPGWYKAMREERVIGRDPSTVLVPEVTKPEVEVVDASTSESPGVTVPDLESTTVEQPDP